MTTLLIAGAILGVGIGGESCARKPSFDGQRAFADLEKQCQFGPRVPNTLAHAEALDFLYNSLRATTELCQKQSFIYYDSLTSRELHLTNLIASYNSQSGQRVLLCAHWDSRPRSEQDPDSTKWRLPILGANDGASGVAVLLEIARCLKEKPPAIGVDIVLFDGEDWGINGREDGWFLGSKYFAAHLGNYRPRLAVLLDMVGDADLRIPREAISQEYARLINDFIWKIARENGSTAFIDSVATTVLDDHVPLLSRGIKAVDIIDFDYPYWHTQQDTPDKCAPGSLESVGRVLLAALNSKEIEKF